MNAINKIIGIQDRKGVLSTLWIYLAVNYIYCDHLGLALIFPDVLRLTLPGVLKTGIATLSIISIFMYKTRKFQMVIVLIAFDLSVCLSIFMLFKYIGAASEAALQLTGWLKILLPVVMAITTWLAYRGLARDEKLVRSYDRLR